MTVRTMGTYLIPALDGGAYGLLLFLGAGGLALAYGTGRMLNLAHGTVFTLGGYTAAILSHGTWPSLIAAVGAGAAAGAGAGAVVALLLARTSGAGPLQQALLTAGLMLVGTDLLGTAMGGNNLPVALPQQLAGTVDIAGHRYPAYRLAVTIVAAGVAAAGFLVLSRSRAGRVVRATAADPDMLACLGISPARVRVGVLVVSGALAGLAGALGGPVIGVGPGTADTVLWLSIVVVVVGGLGSVPGALVAAVGVGEVQTLGVAALPRWVTPYLLDAAVAAALLLRTPALMLRVAALLRWRRPPRPTRTAAAGGRVRGTS
jgi:branched-subunit amino acid ABC-type transport system permease component